LPTDRTIREWCKRVDCTPGFSEVALNMIMKKVQQEEETGGRKVLLSMCLDEMSLRKFIVFSGKL
jgi:hypothetical protein